MNIIIKQLSRILGTAAGCACLWLSPLVASGQPAAYPIEINSQRSTAPAIEAFQAEEKTYRVTFKDGTNFSDVSSSDLFMGWATSAYASTYVTATWARVDGGSNGVVDFTFSSTDLNTNGSGFIYFVGANSTYRQGAFTITPNPWSTGVAAPTFTSNINWSLYTWSNTPDWVTNNQTGVTLSGNFIGDGSNMTNLPVQNPTNAVAKTGDTMTGDLTLAGLATTMGVNRANEATDVTISTVAGPGLYTAILRSSDTDGEAQLWLGANGSYAKIKSDGDQRLDFNSNYIEQLGGVYGDLIIADLTTNTIVRISATSDPALQVGTNSFKAYASGDIWQGSDNTATLGVVTATSFAGDGSGLTGISTGIATTDGVATNLELWASPVVVTQFVVSGDGKYAGTYQDSGDTYNGETVYTNAALGAQLFYTVDGGGSFWNVDTDRNTQYFKNDYYNLNIIGAYTPGVGTGTLSVAAADSSGSPALTIRGALQVDDAAEFDGSVNMAAGRLLVSESSIGHVLLTITEHNTDAALCVVVDENPRITIPTQGANLGMQVYRSFLIGANQDSLSATQAILVTELTGLDTNWIDANTSATGADLWVEDNAQIAGGLLIGTGEVDGITLDAGMVTAQSFSGDGEDISNVNKSGFHSPYVITPAATVTINPTNGWWQSLVSTGSVTIALTSKSSTNAAGSVRLDLYMGAGSATIPYENTDSLSIGAASFNSLLFDNMVGRGVTNWVVNQLYP